MNGISQRKKELRGELKRRRMEITPEKRAEFDKAIFDIFTNSLTFRHTDTLLAYYSVNGEVSTLDVIKTALDRNIRVFLPRCTKDQSGDDIMFFHKIRSLSELRSGMYGIPEPSEDFPLFEPKGHNVCIVPGLAFDKKGFRIGYGKGYYDRFLRNFCGTKVGFCYSDFFVDKLPVGKYDTGLDMLITEKGIYNFNA